MRDVELAERTPSAGTAHVFLRFNRAQETMDYGLLFGAVAWVAMCIPASRELWRGYRWPKVAATVTGYELFDGYQNDGWLLVHFQAPPNDVQINAKLSNPESKSPFPYCWPVGSIIKISCDPNNSANVTWPRNRLLLVILHVFFFLPFFAWGMHAL
ncbi:MAG TPA: hypothetical protein ENI17_09220 [Pseudomonas xinjiangensis]|uniref:Uncharacterized protein n=1 Tax=Halopseudomonas xinjiangensis TaxID=487184 RepID=A0A7V1BKW2_9GAMM|nr:hypothetical protein [Halopseudomonas xinjiangensis]HEC47795.1 hypothetical protein [Halopseudomonas xinjiangensis]